MQAILLKAFFKTFIFLLCKQQVLDFISLYNCTFKAKNRTCFTFSDSIDY